MHLLGWIKWYWNTRDLNDAINLHVHSWDFAMANRCYEKREKLKEKYIRR